MKLTKLAEDYIRRARVRVKSAELAYSDREFPDVVRYSQECVEFSLKACLRIVGIEYPKEHDVGRILKSTSDRFPEWFKDEIEKLRDISEDLTSKRAPSMYGIESAGKAPSDIFDERDANEALLDAKYVLNVAERLLFGLKE